MTLLVRNEADVIDAHVAFHLSAGVDFVIATDHGSEDGTAEILESYARTGRLHCIHHPERSLSQVECVTGMARLAATDFSADWVINSDGDEFWWPRGGTLKDVLASVPPRFGSVRGMWRHFVPRPSSHDFFAERMTARLCLPITERHHAFNPHFKTAHRADPGIEVGGGGHDASGNGLQTLYGWYPIDILHFPVRSLEQCERKYVQHSEWRRGYPLDPHMQEPYDAYRAGRIGDYYTSLLVEDDALDAGVRQGKLAVDTRLRNALRLLRAGGSDAQPQFAISDELRFDNGTVDEGYLSEVAVLEDHDSLAHAQRRVEALDTRLTSLERNFRSRLRHRRRAMS